MSRFVGLLAALTMIASIPAGSRVSAEAGLLPTTGGPMVVSVTNGRIHLSLTLPGTTYPRNALVFTTVRLTNNTGHTINTWDCLHDSLGTAVVGPDGIQQYPPLLPPPGAPWRDCPGGMGGMGTTRQMVSISAGETITRSTYVVLRAPAVRAWASLQTAPGQGKPTLIQTPVVHIQTIAGSGPTVRIQAKPTALARVTLVPGAGPLEYSEFASCADRAHAGYPAKVSATFSQWMRVNGTVVHPFSTPCTALGEWMLFVAQPGKPVAQVYFCARRDRCAYSYLRPSLHDRALAACKIDIGRAVTAGRLPVSAARYAIGLTSSLPAGLSPAQAALAQAFHTRCAPLLKRPRHPPATATPSPGPANLASIVRLGPAPPPDDNQPGNPYGTYRGNHDFTAYLERPPNWREDYLFAIRYARCPAPSSGALRITFFHGMLHQTDTGKIVASLTGQYSQTFVDRRTADRSLFRVPVIPRATMAPLFPTAIQVATMTQAMP